MTDYVPFVLSVRMSDHGYWVCDVSLAPDRTVSVMIAQTGITPEKARELALSRLPPMKRSIPI